MIREAPLWVLLDFATHPHEPPAKGVFVGAIDDRVERLSLFARKFATVAEAMMHGEILERRRRLLPGTWAARRLDDESVADYEALFTDRNSPSAP